MAQYYVSSSYSGTISNGSLSTPWKSLSQVQSNLTNIKSGDIVSFKCNDVFSGGTLSINNKSGITFNSYGTGDRPKIIGNGTKIAHVIYTNNSKDLVFDYLWITDPTIDVNDRTIQSKNQRAFTFDGGSTLNSNITVSNCIIELVGVGAYMVTSNNTLINCKIGNLRMVVNDTTNPYNDYGANPVVISSSRNKIMYNYFHDCWAQSFDFGTDGGAIEIYADTALLEDNFIGYNTFIDCNGVLEIGGSGSNNKVNNTVLAYNKLINNGSALYVHNSDIFATNVTNTQFYNNVIVESKPYRISSSAMFAFKSTPTIPNSLILKNNVIQLYGTIDVCRPQWNTIGALVHTNNVYKLGNGSILNFNQDSTEITTNAVIWNNTTDVNPLNWDFSPSINSILINKGINLGYTKDFAGKDITDTPDIGILEATSIIPTTPLTIDISSTPILVFNGTSTVIVSASGGTAPYTGIGTFIKSAGTHEFSVTDSTGVSVTKSIIISQPAELLITTSHTPITTNGGTTSVTINGTGGVKPYTYSKDNITFVTNNVFSNLLAGTYTFYIKDSNGTKASSTLTLTQPTSSSFLINGLTVRPKNGVAPITYSIDNGQYQTSGTFNNLVLGKTYTIKAKDGQGVIRTMTVTIQS